MTSLTKHCVLRMPAGEFALLGMFGMLPMNAKDDKGEPLRVQGSVPPLTWNAISQVFPAEGFPELFEQYKASFLQGGPHVFSTTYKVGRCRDAWDEQPVACCK
jgi:hypothetical protein